MIYDKNVEGLVSLLSSHIIIQTLSTALSIRRPKHNDFVTPVLWKRRLPGLDHQTHHFKLI